MGSVPRRLITFAIPFLISNIIQSLYNVADMVIVGNMSGGVATAAMSGVNIGRQVTFLLTNLTIGLCAGATVLIGQYVGSNDQDGLKKVTSTILTMLLLFGAVLTVIMYALINPILTLIRTPAESYGQTRDYLSVTLAGIIFIFGYNALGAIMRGMGDSKHPLWFVTIACVTNVILDIILVAVFKMAAFGAALATVVSQGLSMALCIIYMRKHNFQFDFKPRSFRINAEQLRLILRIGLPTSLNNGIVSMSFLFLTSIINTLGVVASAAVGAVGKFNSFAFMPTAAISGAVAAMAAQNIGANRLDRAVHTAKIGTYMSMAITYAFFAFVMLKPEWVVSLFNRDSDIIEAGKVYIRAFSYDLLLIPILFNLNNFLLAGGHSMFTMLTGLVSSVLLRVPICYLLAVTLDMGLRGVGFGAPAASLGSLIIVIIYLSTGKWKHNVAKGRRQMLYEG